MTQPFLGEIQIFSFNYAPFQWSVCNGALVAIRQNTALFSLIGTYYGGDGSTTFGLPNLFEQSAGGQGQGPSLTPRVVGEEFGQPSVSLSTPEMPAHTHTTGSFYARSGGTQTPAPSAGDFLISNISNMYVAAQLPNVVLSPSTIQPTGGSIPHENRQPLLALNYSIALAGNFPSFG